MDFEKLVMKLERYERIIEKLKRKNYLCNLEVGRLVTELKAKNRKPKEERKLTDKQIDLLLSGNTEEEKIPCVCCGEILSEEKAKYTSQTCSEFCYGYYHGEKLTALGRKIIKESSKTFKLNPDSGLRT